MTDSRQEEYAGFEQGVIRPPSEAGSLLIRATRNCPWNQCIFCPVYKCQQFSRRPAGHVKRDIDSLRECVELLREAEGSSLPGSASVDQAALEAALRWVRIGHMESVFIQDSDSLVLPTEQFVDIVSYLRKAFPEARRVTTYARSRTLLQKSVEELTAIREAGLDRVHVGFESGSDAVLELMRKGASKAHHIQAGKMAKEAGLELSEYYMPGLGGRAMWEEHARESAEALCEIQPDYIRLRTLAVPDNVPLAGLLESGSFEQCSFTDLARELIVFLEGLANIQTLVRSDHFLNAFALNGRLPADRPRMLEMLHTFLEMPPERQAFYQLGRRLGVFKGLKDMAEPRKKAHVEEECQARGVTPENVDGVCFDILRQRRHF